MAAADGGVFCFGNAIFFGSVAGHSHGRTVDMSSRAVGDGYWIANND